MPKAKWIHAKKSEDWKNFRCDEMCMRQCFVVVDDIWRTSSIAFTDWRSLYQVRITNIFKFFSCLLFLSLFLLLLVSSLSPFEPSRQCFRIYHTHRIGLFKFIIVNFFFWFSEYFMYFWVFFCVCVSALVIFMGARLIHCFVVLCNRDVIIV